MATRIYFKANKNGVEIKEIDFTFYSGLAPNQKKKSRDSMHKSILRKELNGKILEVSTKSDDEFGKKLSAFNLILDNRPFECAFQEAKRFEIRDSVITNIELDTKDKGKIAMDISDRLICDNGAYYLEPKNDNPRELRTLLKAFMKANKNAKLSHFVYKGEMFEINAGVANSESYFYDFLYFKALGENFSQSEIKQILQYDIFTDIEFNHKVSINCQARSCALYHYALSNNKVEFYMESREKFKGLYERLKNGSLC